MTDVRDTAEGAQRPDTGQPAPRPRAPRAFAIAALLAAAFAASFLPGERPGLGVLVVGLVVAGIAAVLAWPPTPWGLVLGALGLGLAAMVVLRGAPWLVAIDLAAALGLGVLAIMRSTRWGEMAEAGFLAVARAPRAPAFLLRGIATGPDSGSRRSWSPALRGAVIAAALLLLFGSLFAAADRAFAQLAEDYLLPSWSLELLPARLFAFVAVAVLAGTLGLLAPRYADAGPGGAGLLKALRLGTSEPRRLGRVEWIVPLILLDLLFALFVTVQATVLFGGDEHVLTTAGLTYADHARQGFFQLLTVGALTLGVVAAAARWADRRGARDERLLKALLGVLCGLTLVVLASALRRLALYEDAFGLTLARFVAHEAVLWIGGLLVLVSVAGATLRTDWLPRVAVVFSAAVLLVGSISDPEARIAGVNVDHWQETGRIDIEYLGALGPDAIPALVALPRALRSCVLPAIVGEIRPPDGLWGWNLARDRARESIRGLTLTSSLCRPDRQPVPLMSR